MTLELYLDAAGATPLAPAAREAIVAALDTFGDPLMIHAPGRAARALLEDARGVVARRDRRPGRRDRVHIRRHGVGGARRSGASRTPGATRAVAS